MDPATIALIVGLVEAAIKDSPELIAEFKALFAKDTVVPQDWLDLKAKVLSMSYAQYVSDSAIPVVVPVSPVL